MLMFFTMMIYIPETYNFMSIVLSVLLFPFYYAFLFELIKILPSLNKIDNSYRIKEKIVHKYYMGPFITKIKEYLK